MRHYHCVKIVQIGTEYGDLWSKSPFSVRIQENTDQEELLFWKLFTQGISHLLQF